MTKLRDYQIKDVHKMFRLKRVLNANEPGLGKTLECLMFRNVTKAESTLIIGPNNLNGVWKYECNKWFGWDSTILQGTPKQRNKILDNLETDILITNFALIQDILSYQKQWDLIIIDEIHLGGLLNHKSKTFDLVRQLKSESLILLTGTPIRKGPQDLFAPLSLLYPRRFQSYWGFVNKYCITLNTPFGKEIFGRPANPKEFKAMLDNYVIRNTKKEVLKELPDKIRSIIPIELDSKLNKYYKELSNELMVEIDDNIIISQNHMINVLRLRQLLICPKILGIDDYGASINALVNELIPSEFEVGRDVVICTPFKSAIPYIVSAIESKLDAKVFTIYGGQTENASRIAERFQMHNTSRKVLIYTIKSGASWTATTASTAFFLGAEWSNIDNLQAEDRIHRITQKNSVNINYLLVSDTIDDILAERLRNRQLSSEWVLNPKDVFQKMSRKGVRK